MKKDPKIFLTHILESISEIENYTKDISDEIKMKYDLIPWKKIAGSRDVLIHHYFEVDNEAVWDTVKKDIPQLKIEINNFIQKL